MSSQLANIFNHQVTGQKFLDIFSTIAETVTSEYEREIIDCMKNSGYPPSFREVFRQLKSLNSELNIHAAKILNDYREYKGHRSVKLTKGCRRIIKASVHNYISRIKTVLNADKFESLSCFELLVPDS